MNTKFIIPASLALTFHAFLLFGLTGRTPPATVSQDAKPSLPTDAIPVDVEDRSPATEPVDGGKTSDDPGGPVLPHLVDIPVLAPPVGAIPIRQLPPVKTDGTLTSIPPGWQDSGDGRESTGIDVVDMKKLDRPPRTRSQQAPIYPDSLRKDGIHGTVVVEFLVDKEGNVCDPVVVRASNPGFIGAAIRAVARWKFEPGRSAGRNVRFRMNVPIVFALEDS